MRSILGVMTVRQGDTWQRWLGFSSSFEEGVGQAQGLPLQGWGAWMGG